MEKQAPAIDLADTMIEQALQQHSIIFPCGDRNDFTECFTQCNDHLVFWYNTADNSTHVMMRKIAN